MATLVVHQPPPPAGLSIDTSKIKTNAIPNKHIPYCSPGPAPATETPATPPATPSSAEQVDSPPKSILHPVDAYTRISKDPPIYALDAGAVKEALDQVAATPLADPKLVFPWLHGLHPENHIQQAFFIARRKALRKTPKCLRGITVVKAGGDLSKSKLKGAISPMDLLATEDEEDPIFLDIDPKEGFSVRNFHIQAAKWAMVSDIVVYKDDVTPIQELRSTAERLAKAQRHYRERNASSGAGVAEFNTFVVRCRHNSLSSLNDYALILRQGDFEDFEDDFPELVAIASDGKVTRAVPDLGRYF